MDPGVGKFDEHARAQRELSNISTNLFRLPAELRNRIYIAVLSNKPEHALGIEHTTKVQGIMHASRHLQTETIPIYYGQPISFWGCDTVQVCGIAIPWLKTLSTAAVKCLRHIDLSFHILRFCEHRGTGRRKEHIHCVVVNIQRDLHKFRCSISCKKHWNRLDEGELDCEVAENLWAEILTVSDRLEVLKGEPELERKDLLAVLEKIQTFDD